MPGQSLEEERAAIWDDKLEGPLLATSLLVALALMEWLKSWTNAPPLPWLYTAMALPAGGFAFYRISVYRPKLRTLRLGIDGEKVVGQYLERLRVQGYHVFHDIVGPDFNVDHVLVGPAGVFTIETKTRSKPAHGDARVTGDAQGLLVNGKRPDRDPVVQARAQSSFIYRQLKESTGKAFTTRPVIVFPGWFIDVSAQRHSNLWVLEPKALPSFLDREPVVLDPSAVAMASFHLSRLIRSGERQGGPIGS